MKGLNVCSLPTTRLKSQPDKQRCIKKKASGAREDTRNRSKKISRKRVGFTWNM